MIQKLIFRVRCGSGNTAWTVEVDKNQSTNDCEKEEQVTGGYRSEEQDLCSIASYHTLKRNWWNQDSLGINDPQVAPQMRVVRQCTHSRRYGRQSRESNSLRLNEICGAQIILDTRAFPRRKRNLIWIDCYVTFQIMLVSYLDDIDNSGDNQWQERTCRADVNRKRIQ